MPQGLDPIVIKFVLVSYRASMCVPSDVHVGQWGPCTLFKVIQIKQILSLCTHLSCIWIGEAKGGTMKEVK